jgi:Protein of unknown function (DUF2934)
MMINSGYFLTFEKNRAIMSNKSSAKKKGKKDDPYLTEEERDESIRLAAYYLWKKKGERHGENRDDWFEAEESVDDIDDSVAESFDD